MTELMTTGQVLELFYKEGLDLSPSTLEYWIRSNVVSPPEKIGHCRIWNQADVSKLRSIVKARREKKDAP